jgi:AcrR family transcriptional regulator
VRPYRHKHSDDRRRAIVEAALACFGEHGLEATTIGHVRARATASTGSIYHHFRDKEGLAAEVYRYVLGQYHASLLAALPAFTTARGLVRGVVRHLLEWAAANRDAVKFLVEMRWSTDVRAHDAGIREDTSEMFAAVAAEIERHVRARALRELPHHLYVAVLAGPALALVARWVRDGMRSDLAADANALADAAWKALACEKGGRHV